MNKAVELHIMPHGSQVWASCLNLQDGVLHEPVDISLGQSFAIVSKRLKVVGCRWKVETKLVFFFSDSAYEKLKARCVLVAPIHWVVKTHLRPHER